MTKLSSFYFFYLYWQEYNLIENKTLKMAVANIAVGNYIKR